jgi:rod shape-determining protein MreD
VSLQIGVPLFLASILLQSTVLSHLRVFGGQPDLIAIFVIVWALLDDGTEGIVWAFVGGLFADLLSGAPLGISVLALMPVAFVLGLADAGIYRHNLLLMLLFGGLGAFGYHLLYLLALRFVAGMPVMWSESFWYVTLPSVLFDLVLVVPALTVLGRWYDRLHPRQVRL